jgi:hypothetical protein
VIKHYKLNNIKTKRSLLKELAKITSADINNENYWHYLDRAILILKDKPEYLTLYQFLEIYSETPFDSYKTYLKVKPQNGIDLAIVLKEAKEVLNNKTLLSLIVSPSDNKLSIIVSPKDYDTKVFTNVTKNNLEESLVNLILLSTPQDNSSYISVEWTDTSHKIITAHRPTVRKATINTHKNYKISVDWKTMKDYMRYLMTLNQKCNDKNYMFGESLHYVTDKEIRINIEVLFEARGMIVEFSTNSTCKPLNRIFHIFE